MMARLRRRSSSEKSRARLVRRAIYLTLILLAVVGGLFYRHWRLAGRLGLYPRQLEIHALNVGQGDGFLILTPKGKAVLIDAGPPEAGETVLEALNREGVRQIDLVVATHPHADHIGGLLKVLDKVPVRVFLDSGQAHPTRTYTRLLEKIRRENIRFIVAEAGQEFELDSGITLHLLAPIRPLIAESRGDVVNVNSIVCRLTYDSFSMLFTGDSEQETENRLLGTYPDLSATVLKVAHHGSRDATGTAFLNRVQPQVAIISCGAENDYGHPAQVTLDRLRTMVSHVYRTDLQGEVMIRTDGNSHVIETDHVADGNLWAGGQPHASGRDLHSKRASGGAGK